MVWLTPKWQTRNIEALKDRLELEIEARKTLAQILGGIILISGLSYLSEVDADRAVFELADLREADLTKAKLTNAYLNEAQLKDAILDGAIFTKADLRDAVLNGASVRGAHLEDAIGLTPAQLRVPVGPFGTDAYLPNVMIKQMHLPTNHNVTLANRLAKGERGILARPVDCPGDARSIGSS